MTIGIGYCIPNRKPGINWSSYCTTLNLAIDGHSFIAPTEVVPPAYLSYTLPYAVNTVSVYNGALGGTLLDHLLENAETIDSKLVTETREISNVLVVWSMTVTETEGSGVERYNLFKPYLAARAAAGWKVFVFTLTPSLQSTGGPQWIVEKEIFNELLRTDLPTNCYCVDTDLDERLDDKSDTSIYYDGLHPSELGGQYALQLLLDKMQEVYSDKIIPDFQIPTADTLFSFNYNNADAMVLNGSNVAELIDEIEGTIKIVQATDGLRPVLEADGILFNGDVLANTFTWDQPATIYMLFKQITWTITDCIWAGGDASSGTLYQSTTTPSIRIYAGTAESSNNLNLPLDTWGIVKVIYDGANSKIKIGYTNTLSVNAGTDNMDGFSLGNLPGYSRHSHIKVRAVVGRTVNDFRTGPEYTIFKALENLIPE